jgi:hypothetical protein
MGWLVAHAHDADQSGNQVVRSCGLSGHGRFDWIRTLGIAPQCRTAGLIATGGRPALARAPTLYPSAGDAVEPLRTWPGESKATTGSPWPCRTVAFACSGRAWARFIARLGGEGEYRAETGKPVYELFLS